MLDGVVPYPPELAAKYRQKGYWTDKSLAQTYDEVFARYADRPALVSGDERTTYGELARRVERTALHLLKLGLKPLDRVVVQLPNVPEFVYLFFALQKIGAIPIMALPPHRHMEIGYFVSHTQATAYAIQDQAGDFNFLELAARLQRENPTLKHILVYGKNVPRGCVPLSDLAKKDSGLSPDALKNILIDPQDPACFQLSGGTTGISKIIPRTHNDYALNARLSSGVIDIHEDDALLVVLPIAHNFPLASPGIMGAMMHGARCVLSTSVRSSDVFPLIEREKITHLEVVPALLVRWIDDPELQRHELSSIRVINSGGQRLQPEVKKRTEELLPHCRVQEVFGMAEGLLLYVRLDDPDEARMETVGRPVCDNDEVRLLDEDGNEVAPGDVGELAVRGPYTLRGYYKAPEHNTRAFTTDGFYLSGDLLQKHPSGNYVVAGRKKDLINRGGEKISAEEIENLILSHPAVHNVAAVPMPDRVLGERMCAYIIPKPGKAITLRELTPFLLEKGVAKFKLPERVELVGEFPMSGFGKVSKKELAERIAAQLRVEGAV